MDIAKGRFSVRSKKDKDIAFDFIEALEIIEKNNENTLREIYTIKGLKDASEQRYLRDKVKVFCEKTKTLNKSNDWIVDAIYYAIGPAIARYTGQYEEGSFGATRTPSFIHDQIVEYEQTAKMEASLKEKIEVMIPCLVAATEVEARNRLDKGEIKREIFVEHLLENMIEGIVGNAINMMCMLRGEEKITELFRNMNKRGVVRKGEQKVVFDQLRKNVDEGFISFQETPEIYIHALTTGAGIGYLKKAGAKFRNSFDDYIELDEDIDFSQGSEGGRKISFSEGFYNPMTMFGEFYEVEGTKRSLFQLITGLSDGYNDLILRTLVGEAGIAYKNEKHLDALRDWISSCEDFGLDDKHDLSLVHWLSANVRRVPNAENIADNVTAFSRLNLIKDSSDQHVMTGPKAVEFILDGMGLNQEGAAKDLIETTLKQKSRKGIAAFISNDWRYSQKRMSILRSLGSSKVTDYFELDAVPVIRMARAADVLGKDPILDTYARVFERLLEIKKIMDSGSTRDEIACSVQIISSYYLLGKNVFSHKRWPFKRLEEEFMKKNFKDIEGVTQSLEGKLGWFREFYLGGRLPFTGRMVAGPDIEIPFGEVGVSAHSMLVLRSKSLVEELPKDGSVKTEVVRELIRGFSSVSKRSNIINEIARRIKNVVSKHGKEGINELNAIFAKDTTEIEDILGRPKYNSIDSIYDLASKIANLPNVSFQLQKINDQNKVILSRFPWLHQQSVMAMKMRLNSDGKDMCVRVHPIMAEPMTLDYDGDQMQIVAIGERTNSIAQIIDQIDPKKTIFYGSKPDQLVFSLDLNSIEGLIKTSFSFVPTNGKVNRISIEELKEAGVDFTISAQDLKDPMALVKAFDINAKKLRDFGYEPMDLYVETKGKYATFQRYALAQITSSLGAKHEQINECFGSVFNAPGSIGSVNKSKYEKILVETGADHEDGIVDRLQCAYSYMCTMASRNSGALKNKMSIKDMMLYVHGHPSVEKLRLEYQEKMSSIEIAHTLGLLTTAERNSHMFKVEFGSKEPEEVARIDKALGEKRLDILLSDLDNVGQAVKEYNSQMDTNIMGYKSAMYFAVQSVCDQFLVEYGNPHFLGEQIFSGKIKAKPELIDRLFKGTFNVQGSDVKQIVYGDLVKGLSADDMLAAYGPSFWRSVQSKVAVPVGGAFSKDVKSSLASMTIARDEEFESGITYQLKDFSHKSQDLKTLWNLINMRYVKLEDKSLNQRLNRLNFEYQPQWKKVEKLLKEVISKEETITVLSVVKDKGFPTKTNPRALGVRTLSGIEIKNGNIHRLALNKGKHAGMKAGGVYGGSIAEPGEQSSLRIRHMNSAKSSDTNKLHEYWYNKFGPFQLSSTYQRNGGIRLSGCYDKSISNHQHMMSANVEGVSDRKLSRVEKLTVIDGICVFPGESFKVEDSKIFIGSNYPEVSERFLSGEDFENVRENGVPIRFEKYRVTMSVGKANELGWNIQAEYENSRKDGKRAVAIDGTVKMIITEREIEQYQGPGVTIDPVVQTEKEVLGKSEFIKVSEHTVINGSVIPKGSIMDYNGRVRWDSQKSYESRPQGFYAYSGYMKDNPMLEHKSELSHHDGIVENIQKHRGFSDKNIYIITIGGNKQTIELQDDQIPSVLVGQKVEKGECLNHGFRSISEFCKILGSEAREAVAKYVFSHNENEGGIYSTLSEIVATVTTSDQGKFTPIDKVYYSDKDYFEDARDQAARHGKMQTIIEESLMGGPGTENQGLGYMKPQQLQNPDKFRQMEHDGVRISEALKNAPKEIMAEDKRLTGQRMEAISIGMGS